MDPDLAFVLELSYFSCSFPAPIVSHVCSCCSSHITAHSCPPFAILSNQPLLSPQVRINAASSQFACNYLFIRKCLSLCFCYRLRCTLSLLRWYLFCSSQLFSRVTAFLRHIAILCHINNQRTEFSVVVDATCVYYIAQ